MNHEPNHTAQNERVDLGKLLKAATRSALVIFLIFLSASVSRALVNYLFDRKWGLDWGLAFVLSGSACGIFFVWSLVSGYVSQRNFAPAGTILDRSPSLSIAPKQAMSGFVGMEYYWLILNRTYVVFAAPNGLYGWKAEGPVSAARPRFYEPYQNMLDDPELTRDIGAVEDLSKLRDGFFIPASEVVSVESSDKAKWGMGSIAHSGRIRVTLASGRSREFILLGSVSPEAIRDRVLSSFSRSI